MPLNKSRTPVRSGERTKKSRIVKRGWWVEDDAEELFWMGTIFCYRCKVRTAPHTFPRHAGWGQGANLQPMMGKPAGVRWQAQARGFMCCEKKSFFFRNWQNHHRASLRMPSLVRYGVTLLERHPGIPNAQPLQIRSTCHSLKGFWPPSFQS